MWKSENMLSKINSEIYLEALKFTRYYYYNFDFSQETLKFSDILWLIIVSKLQLTNLGLARNFKVKWKDAEN